MIVPQGLIPADPETWKVRRRAIVPGFHKGWLNAMVSVARDEIDTDFHYTRFIYNSDGAVCGLQSSFDRQVGVSCAVL